MDNARESISKILRQYIYYIIISLVSLVALVVLPMLSYQDGDISITFDTPTNTIGWFLYVISKLTVAALNILIFYSFMQQGKLTASKSIKYQKAIEILSDNIESEEYQPRSPRQYTSKQYRTKPISIIIGTVVGLVGFGEAIMGFDVPTFLTYLIVIVGGVITGVISMLSSEEYWSNEFYDYAKRLEKEKNIKNTVVEEIETNLFNYEERNNN